MEAFAQLGHTVKFNHLMLDVLDHEGSKDTSLRPNTDSFSLVIKSWITNDASSSRYNIGERLRYALKWLEELIEREDKGFTGSSTSVELFTTILNACKKAHQIDHTILEVGLATLKKNKESRHHVDSLSYTRILQIGLGAMCAPEDNMKREKFLRDLVKDCCEDGLVSKGFVSALANSPMWSDGWTIEESEKYTMEFFGCWPIPNSWTRNIKNANLLPTPEDTQRTVEGNGRYVSSRQRVSF